MEKRILIVDDEPSAISLLERHLTTAGYEVLTAANGVEALRVVLSEAPPMVITDWVMPELDGVELCRALRTHEGVGFVYIIILTAYVEDGRVVQALDAGADDFLTKPFNRDELLARIRAGERVVALEAGLAQRNRQVFKYNAKLAIVNEKLERAATTDDLTGLVNRRAAMARLAECWSLSNRFDDPLAYMVLDIDHFKQFNDIHGHAVGDRVLKEVANTLNKTTRFGEVVCRFGGEEFLVICPQSTAQMAGRDAEHLRRAIEALSISTNGHALSVTVSSGVAQRTESMNGPDDLLKLADQALYSAKRSGRNQVVVSGQTGRLADTQNLNGFQAACEQTATGGKDSHHQPSLTAKGSPPIKETVLVADDDADSRAICRSVLEREGYTVFEAVDGFDALEHIHQHSPDVVVMDAAMSNLNGLECARQIKQDPATWDIPVIIASSKDQEAHIIAGLEDGVDEYITKPLRPRELVVRVRSMARLHRSRMELVRVNESRAEQARTMMLLLELAQSLTTAKTLDVVLEKIVSVTAELTCSRRISIMLPDEQRKYLTIARAMGVDETIAAGVRVPVGGAISGRVFASAEQVVINAPEKGQRWRHDDDSQFFTGVPLISNPIGSADHVVGVLNITERYGGKPFGPCDLGYVDLICNIAAPAIEEIAACQARDEARDSIVVGLAKLTEHRDGATGRHLDRVTRFALLLAEELRTAGPFRNQMDDEFLGDLKRAVPLHDIGKVGIPDRILLKPGKLTSEERTVMQTHTQIGTETIRSVADRVPGARFLTMAAEIAWSHHEWYDGSGYPRGLKGHETPLPARVVALADVYDALTTKRPYKDSMAHKHAVKIIRDGSGAHFDPAIVDAFLVREHEFAALAAELADDDQSADSRRSSAYAKQAKADAASDPLKPELNKLDGQPHQLADLYRQTQTSKA